MKDKAAKYNVPLPKVRMQSENEVFKPMKSGKRGKSWKRLVTKVTYVPENFTRKPPKFERFIRPMGEEILTRWLPNYCFLNRL